MIPLALLFGGVTGFYVLMKKYFAATRNEDEKCITCPCHASASDIHGDVIHAPAPRPLDLFPVTIENGVIKIDTGQLIRRKTFESGQVVRA